MEPGSPRCASISASVAACSSSAPPGRFSRAASAKPSERLTRTFVPPRSTGSATLSCNLWPSWSAASRSSRCEEESASPKQAPSRRASMSSCRSPIWSLSPTTRSRCSISARSWRCSSCLKPSISSTMAATEGGIPPGWASILSRRPVIAARSPSPVSASRVRLRDRIGRPSALDTVSGNAMTTSTTAHAPPSASAPSRSAGASPSISSRPSRPSCRREGREVRCDVRPAELRMVSFPALGPLPRMRPGRQGDTLESHSKRSVNAGPPDL